MRRQTVIIISCLAVILLFSYLPAFGLTFGGQSSEEASKVSFLSPLTGAQNPSDVKIPEGEFDSHVRTPWKGPKLVVIDAGHGGKDPGTSSGIHSEKDISLDIAKKVEVLLKDSGIPTYMTRTDDTYISPVDRISTANIKNAALFVSIHCNWYNSSYERGIMTLRYPSETLATGYLTEKDYASILHDTLVSIPGVRDAGIVDRPSLAVLRHAEMPSLILELGFMSNKSDLNLLTSEEFRKKAAASIAEGIKKSMDKVYSN